MDKFRIRGGQPLSGEIAIGGAKNAGLPLMAAGLLTDERLTLTNVPLLADVLTMSALLAQHGIAVDKLTNDGRALSIGGPITNTEAPYDIVRKMRASILVLGPLVARVGEARVSLPGGCAIGLRPIDLHIKGLEAMGAEISLDSGYVTATAPRGPGGRDLRDALSQRRRHRKPADGGLPRGWPDRARQCRAGAGDRRSRALPDRHGRADRRHRHGSAGHRGREGVCTAPAIASCRTGSRPAPTPAPRRFPAAACICAMPASTDLDSVVQTLGEAGVEITEHADGVMVRRLNGLHGVDFKTEPYPGFPTDMQAQLMALMTVADGASMITENIFENRFAHAAELNRMGARINVHGASAIVRGVKELSGAQVMASDLRASFGWCWPGWPRGARRW